MMEKKFIDSLKEIEEIEKSTPVEEFIPFKSTYEAIYDSAMSHSDKTAISFFLSGDDYKNSIEVTYKDLISNITRTANFFHSLGLREDDTVAFVLPNLPETHYVLWGAEAACRVFAVNSLLDAEKIRELVNATEAKAVVTMAPIIGSDLWEKVSSIATELYHTRFLIGVDITHYVPSFPETMKAEINEKIRVNMELLENIEYFDLVHEIREIDGEQLKFDRTYQEDTVSSMFCTGGTTGLPKIAQRTHRNEIFDASAVKTFSQEVFNSEAVILAGVPLLHVTGALATGLVSFMSGGSLVMTTPSGYRGQNVFSQIWNIVEHYRVTAMIGVPTVYAHLLNIPLTGQDISSLEYCMCGSAPFPTALYREFANYIDAEVIEAYGLTEGTCISSGTPPGIKEKIGSIGLRLPHQKMACAHIEENRVIGICDTNEVGALLIRGPDVFMGYLQPIHNQDIWVTDSNGDTWFNTGDLARQDKDGYFWLTGRKKEIIVRGGHNIEPKMIEEVLCQHPQVSLAAAVGQPDAYAGEIPTCYVQLLEGANIEEEELLKFAQENIFERAAIPKRIHILDSIPITPVGKVFKPALESMEIRRCIVREAENIHQDTSFEVKIVESSPHGKSAHVILTSWKDNDIESLKKSLAHYSFNVTLEM